MSLIEEPTPNLPLLRKVLDHINAHPEEWNQGDWGVVSQTACGTAFCVAGHALIMSGYRTRVLSPEEVSLSFYGPTGEEVDPEETARALLGLNQRELDLFDPYNERDDVQRIAEQIAARVGEVL